MEYTSDSDLSDDTRDLVKRGLASVKRKRRIVTTQSDDVHDRFLDSNMDTSNVRHPSWRGVSIGDTSTHGLAATGVETANSQNHNTRLVCFQRSPTNTHHSTTWSKQCAHSSALGHFCDERRVGLCHFEREKPAAGS